MAKALILVPFALDEAGMANRHAQIDEVRLGPDITFDFRPVTAGPESFMSAHDWALMEMAIFEAGLSAQEDGYDAICIDTMSDTGLGSLRSMLDIPVVAPGRASMLTALMLGTRFGVLAHWEPHIARYHKAAREYGLGAFLASVRSFDTPPDFVNMLSGREDELFPKMLAACELMVGDGADVICLGTTVMHQAAGYLADNLPVPVINPGPLTYKLVEMLLGLGLSHSRTAYPRPLAPKPEMIRAMLRAAAETERA